MSSLPPAEGENRRRSRFPFGELARVLLVPVIAVVAFILLFLDPGGGEQTESDDGMKRIALLQKDARFRVVPASEGGASGSIWYTTSGPELAIELEAEGLVPGKRYLLEMAVDEAIYTLASYSSSDDGELSADTTLTSFAEGACVGPNWDPPRPLAGPHAIRFWLKLDGNPQTGSGRVHAPQFTEGADLPCSGNGDGDYTYVLFENEVAHYTGPPSQAPSSEGKSGASSRGGVAARPRTG